MWSNFKNYKKENKGHEGLNHPRPLFDAKLQPYNPNPNDPNHNNPNRKNPDPNSKNANPKNLNPNLYPIPNPIPNPNLNPKNPNT